MNDRHRTEISFLGRMIYLLVLGGVDTYDKASYDALNRVAYECYIEPLADIPPNEKKRIIRRTLRMEQHTIAPLSGNAHGQKVLLIAYFFINRLVEEGYIDLPEGSNLAILVDKLLSVVDSEDDGVKKQMGSAKKAADKWIEKLRSEGYYQ